MLTLVMLTLVMPPADFIASAQSAFSVTPYSRAIVFSCTNPRAHSATPLLGYLGRGVLVVDVKLVQLAMKLSLEFPPIVRVNGANLEVLWDSVVGNLALQRRSAVGSLV